MSTPRLLQAIEGDGVCYQRPQCFKLPGPQIPPHHRANCRYFEVCQVNDKDPASCLLAGSLQSWLTSELNQEQADPRPSRCLESHRPSLGHFIACKIKSLLRIPLNLHPTGLVRETYHVVGCLHVRTIAILSLHNILLACDSTRICA